jgi:hypothetical protein
MEANTGNFSWFAGSSDQYLGRRHDAKCGLWNWLGIKRDQKHQHTQFGKRALRRSPACWMLLPMVLMKNGDVIMVVEKATTIPAATSLLQSRGLPPTKERTSTYFLLSLSCFPHITCNILLRD